MNNSAYKKVISKLKEKHNFPKNIPEKEQCYQGYFSDSNQRLIKKYLYCNDKLIVDFGSYLGESTKYLCESTNPGATIIATADWENNKIYKSFLTNLWYHKDRVIPLKMNEKNAIKYLHNLEVRPDLVFLNIIPKYMYEYFELLHEAFPNTLFIGSTTKTVSKKLKKFIEKTPQYRIEIDHDSFAIIPNIQKYNQSENHGLEFEMIGPNEDDCDEKVAIIVPLICKINEKKCDMQNMLKKHYLIMNDVLKTMRRPFHVYYISQIQDGRPMNIGKLLNAGFKIAQKECEVFIFQSNQVIPLKNIIPYYNSYPHQPVCLEAKRENYDYENYNLGTMYFTEDDFERCNGYTNDLWGQIGYDYSLWLRLATNHMKLGQPLSGGFKNSNAYNNLRHQFITTEQSDKIYKKHWGDWKKDGLKDLQFTIEKEMKCDKYSSFYEIGLKDFEYYLAPTKDMVFPISYFQKPIPFKWNLQFGDRPTPPMKELVGDPEEYLKSRKDFMNFFYKKKDLNKEILSLIETTLNTIPDLKISKKKIINFYLNQIYFYKNYIYLNINKFMYIYFLDINRVNKFKYFFIEKILGILPYFKNKNLIITLCFILIEDIKEENLLIIKHNINKILKNKCKFNIIFNKLDNIQLKDKYNYIEFDSFYFSNYKNKINLLEYNYIYLLLFNINILYKYLEVNGSCRFKLYGISTIIHLDIIILLINLFKNINIIHSFTEPINTKVLKMNLFNKNKTNINLDSILYKIKKTNNSLGKNLNNNSNNKHIVKLIDIKSNINILLLENIKSINYYFINFYKNKFILYNEINLIFELNPKLKKKIINNINEIKKKVFHINS